MEQFDRSQVIDEQFKQCLREQQFPKPRTLLSPQAAGLDKATFLALFDSQLLSRQIDLWARILRRQGTGYYTIASSGHEGNAAFGLAFQHTDMALLHYRSGAFFIQRAKKLPEQNVIRDLLRSLMASKLNPIAQGRHKVFGSVPLYIPPQTSTIASHVPKALGIALSITRAKELAIQAELRSDSVVICSFGDASLNHACIQTTLNAAAWIRTQKYPLPLVFICEDNGLGISVPTPKHWVAEQLQSRPEWHYLPADGLHLPDIYQKAEQAARIARVKKQPVFLHVHCVRLMGHAGSDIEAQYQSREQIEAQEAADPLLHTARIAIEQNWLTAEAIIDRYQAFSEEISELAKEVSKEGSLADRQEVMQAILPIANTNKPTPPPSDAIRKKKLGPRYEKLKERGHLAQQLNLALAEVLLQYDNALLFGEDVGKKGGVYQVSAGLQQLFGARRVFDTLLDETTILGTAIGLAHNGFLPIAEIQFLAYLYNAIDQLRGEAASLSFFSSGQYSNPLLIRIPSFAYQQSLGGHFHNENSIACLRDIPGLIIACPSNGADAVQMLRQCMQLLEQQRRIVVFLEPIALYMKKDLQTKGDQRWLTAYPDPKQMIHINEVGLEGTGKDVLIVSYANGFYLACQALNILQEKYGIAAKAMDLRWLKPLPEKQLLEQATQYNAILIIDECRHNGSLSEALVALFVERLTQLPKIKRLTAADSFIPLGPSSKTVVPSLDDVVQAVVDIM